jgi:hypothetical protein
LIASVVVVATEDREHLAAGLEDTAHHRSVRTVWLGVVSGIDEFPGC